MNLLINILPFVYFALVLYYLWKRNPLKNMGIPHPWLMSMYTLKVGAGTLLWVIFTYYYTERTTSDAFRFFDDAKIMHQALFEDPVLYLKMLFGFDTDDPALQKYIVRMFNWDKEYNYFMYNDSRTMLRFNAVCMLFSFGNYHVHTLCMSAFSLIGGIYLFKAFYPFLKDKKYLLLLSVFCIPGVIFYSSGVLKEGILIPGLGFFFYALFRLSTHYTKPRYWLLLAIGIGILLVMKIYILICLAPAFMYYILSGWVLKKQPLILFICFNVLVFVGLWALSELVPDKNIFYMLYKKKEDFSNVAMQNESGSFIHTPDLYPTAAGLLLYIPFALYTVLMRPYIWEDGGMLSRLAGLENILLAGCMITPLFFMKKTNIQERRIIYMLVLFIFYLYILIGVTTPVLGALTRYKAPALPFILVICLLCTDTEKIKKIIPFKHL